MTGTEREFIADGDAVSPHSSASSPSRGRQIVDHLLSHGGDVELTTDEIWP
jgi:hypothetical protein